MDQAPHIPQLIFPKEYGRQAIALEGEAITVGRLSDQDLVLQERCVSRHHAVLQRAGDTYELVDQGSSHGTWVNGQRVERAVLSDGDVLQFGAPTAIGIRFQLSSKQTSAVRNPPTELLATVNFLMRSKEQVSAPARELEQLNFLLTAAHKLNAGAAKNDILHALLQLSIQLTGVERGFVFLNDGGEMRLSIGLRSGGEVIDEDTSVSRSAMRHAIESGERFSVSDTLADSKAGAWESVQINSIRCIYCIPLRKRTSREDSENLLGLLYLDSQLGPGQLSEVDHQLLDAVATEAATLLENVLLAEAEKEAAHAAEELAIAARIHGSLMAAALPEVPYAKLKARTIPCKAIGGDFYDAIELEDCLAVTIADVSGKGVPASIVAATMQGIIHAQLLSGQTLEQIADLLNRFLCSRGVGKYATLVMTKLYPDGRFEYVNCAHIRPLLVTGEGAVCLEETNLMVGLIAGAEYSGGSCILPHGARVLLATDGVTEAENPGEEQFGEDRFKDIAGAEELEGILRAVDSFQAGCPAQDDCTIVEFEYVDTKGASAS